MIWISLLEELYDSRKFLILLCFGLRCRVQGRKGMGGKGVLGKRWDGWKWGRRSGERREGSSSGHGVRLTGAGFSSGWRFRAPRGPVVQLRQVTGGKGQWSRHCPARAERAQGWGWEGKNECTARIVTFSIRHLKAASCVRLHVPSLTCLLKLIIT